MNEGAWLGLSFGAGIGATYVLAQWWELKKRARTIEEKGPSALLTGAVLRMVFLVVALVVVVRWTEADKYWLTGSLAAVYSLWLVWRMKQLGSGKKA